MAVSLRVFLLNTHLSFTSSIPTIAYKSIESTVYDIN